MPDIKNIYDLHGAYKIIKIKSFTVKYFGQLKFIRRRFGFDDTLKVIIKMYSSHNLSVQLKGDSLGIEGVAQFNHNWEIIDRRLLIEKTGFYI